MRYAETVVLKGGVELLVRNAVASDARVLRETTQRTHAQTDYRCPSQTSRTSMMSKGPVPSRKRNAVAMRLSSLL